MLFHLEPSVEVTGGPWYTDKELDTEFIKLLSAACLKFIKDRVSPMCPKKFWVRRQTVFLAFSEFPTE